MPIASDPAAVPFVGRDAPLNLLKMAAEAAFKDGAGAAVLSGEPGLGKTRLMEQLAAALAGKSRAAMATCLDRPLAPLTAFRELLTSAADFLGRPPPEVAPDLARFFPHLDVEPSEELDPAFERRRLFRGIETWLRKAARNRPLLLAIDNFQWADSTSVALFRHLATSLKAPVMLVAATRQQDLRTFWHPRIHRMSIGALSEEDGKDLVTGLLGKGALSDHAFASIWHKCGGNPGAFLEALRSLEDSGLLRQGLGGWIAPYQLPPRQWDEAVLARVEKLDAVSRDLLQMLAVVERADADALVRLSLVDPDQVAQKLSALVQKGLVVQRGPVYAFSPPYVRELIYESIPSNIRQELHLAAGELLEGDADAVAHDLAYHFSRSQPRKAVAYLVSLGEDSLGYSAADEAMSYLGQAIAYMESLSDHEDRGLLAACRESLGALLAERDPERAAPMLELVVKELREMVESRLVQSRTKALRRLVSYLPAPLSEKIKTSLYNPKYLIPRNISPEERLESAMRSLAVAEGTRGNYERAQDLLDQVAETVSKDAVGSTDLAVIAARFQAEAGFFPRAAKMAQDALDSLLRNKQRRTLGNQIFEVELRFITDLVMALRGEASNLLGEAPDLQEEIGPSLGFTPDLPRLVRCARQGRWRLMEEIALRHGEAWADKPAARWAVSARAWALYEARVPRLYEEALAEAATLTDPVSMATVALIRAIEQAEGGDVQPLEDCVLAMRKSKSFLLTQALVSLGEALLPQSGPTTINRVKGLAIEAHLRATEAKFRNPCEEPATLRLMAEVAMAEKDFKNAISYLRQAIERAESVDSPLQAGWGWLGRVRLFIKMGNYEHARECLGKARDCFVQVEHRRGLAAVDELEIRVEPNNPVRDIMSLRGMDEEPGLLEIAEEGDEEVLSRTFAPLRQRQSRGEAVRSVAAAVMGASDEQGILEAVAEAGALAIGADRGFCRTVTGSWAAWPADAYEDLLQNGEDLIDEVRAAGAGRLQTEVPGPDGPLRSALAVPLRTSGVVRAVFYAEAPPRWFEERDVFLLESVLAYGGLALDGSGMEVRIAENEALLEAIDGLGLAVGKPSGQDRILSALLRQAAQDLGPASGWVLQGGTLVLAGVDRDGNEFLDASGAREDAILQAEQRGEPVRLVAGETEGVLVAPIAAEGFELGILYLHRTDQPFERGDEDLLGLVAARMASVLLTGHRLEQQRRRMADVETALIMQRAGRATSITDGLTGLYTRDYFLDSLEREFAVSRRYGHSLSVLVVMIDGLERFRQVCGVESADEVFRQVCMTVRGKSRDIDLAARIGGEVVGLILPFTDQDGGLFVAERVRRSVAALAFPSDAGGAITASVGLAEAHLTDSSGRVVLDKALGAMRKAHRAGGNRIQRASEEVTPPIFEVRQLRASRQETYIGMVESLCAVLEEKDAYPQIPAREMSDLAAVLGKAMGAQPNDIEHLQLAARFCDVGKIGVPEGILVKNETLNAAEWRAMRNHPKLGFQILKSGNLHHVAEIVLYHHEHWDGSGYPSGLAGEKIPLLSRIVAVLHAFRSMMSDRPWRKALGLRKTLDELQAGSGTLWDPAIVTALTQFLTRM